MTSVDFNPAPTNWFKPSDTFTGPGWVHDERVSEAKPYRVFYRFGVYEYYDNIGPGPYHEYARRPCVAAYNTRAKAWAKFL